MQNGGQTNQLSIYIKVEINVYFLVFIQFIQFLTKTNQSLLYSKGEANKIHLGFNLDSNLKQDTNLNLYED